MESKLNFDVEIMTSEVMKSLNIPIATKKPKNAKTIDDISQSKLISNVRVSDLIIDLSYQRKPNAVKVAKIVNNFDPDAIGVLVCSMREDGTIAVIDGGHRVAALNAMNLEATNVRCLVFFDLTLKKEAEMFTILNDNRTKPKTQDIFKSKVVAGDKDAVQIKKILDVCGLSISTGPANNSIRAMGTVSTIYKREGDFNLIHTINCLSAAFDKHSTSFSDSALIAVSKIIATYGNDKIDYPRLISSLATFGSANLWRNKGAIVSKTMGYKDVNIGMIVCLLSEYNKRLKSKRLDIKEIV
jgi:hypothetical protein